MIPHRDEILRPAVSTDATAVPRYNLVRPDGTIIEKNVALKLANPVAQAGTPISKAALDEMLAASGVTTGTATAYTLAQEEYTLSDGAPVRFRLHTASGDGATLNINGTGAKPLRDMMGAAMPGGIPAGTWLTAYYSAAIGAYVLVGGEAIQALYGERYTVDDAVAYVKDVPADALPVAEVGEIGGMTYKVNVGTEAAPVYELRSAPVTEMESVGVNLFDANHYNIIDGYFTTTTQAIIGASQTKMVYVRCIPNTTYTISKRASARFAVGFTQDVPAAGVVILDAQFDTTEKLTTFTAESPDNAQYMAVWVYHADHDTLTLDEILSTLMIYRGTIAKPYTPYQRHTLPIPEAVRALDGYGWGINAELYNYIDRKNKKFVKRVGCVDLGMLSWDREDRPTLVKQRFVGYSATGASSAQITNTNILCAKYTASDAPVAAGDIDMTIALWGGAVYVLDSTAEYTDAVTFKAAMSGVMLYYKLAEPVITDISSILAADNFFRVQPGGTITPINEYNYAVPTTITYQRDVLANRASTFALEKLRLAMELLASIDYVDDTVSAAIADAVAPLATTAALNAAVAPLAKAEAITTAINAHKAESTAHNAASIVTDTSRQFVTAAEKAAWNAGGGSAKILSNTRITSDSNSITINLPTDYNYFRIILSEVATTDTSLGTVRGSLNASSLDSSGMQLGAGDSEGAAFVMSTESTSYLFAMMLADDKTFGSVAIDIARHSGTIQGACSWVTDGNGSDANVGMAMHTFSASDDATTMTISTLGSFYLRHGMGILVLGAK